MEIFPEKKRHSEILGREKFFLSPQIRRQVSTTEISGLQILCSHTEHC